jgi:orotate phosphoribosyltransferase
MDDMHVLLYSLMNQSDKEVIGIFEETKALLKGHFILRSGLRSEYFFQCAQVCQYMDKVTRLAELMIKHLVKEQVDLIIAPAMGGLVIGQEVARQLGARFIFLEKVNDMLALRRNFGISYDDRVLLVEDVVTRGGRVKEAIKIIEDYPCQFLGAISLVDRSTETLNLEVPFSALLKIQFPTYQVDDLPQHLQNVPATKPGS